MLQSASPTFWNDYFDVFDEDDRKEILLEFLG